MLNEIIAELGDNYNTSDSAVLEQIIDDTTSNALFISNRSNTVLNVDLLKPEIKQSVISQYLRRGTEDTTSLNESGKSSSFVNYIEQLENNIIKNGKRVVK